MVLLGQLGVALLAFGAAAAIVLPADGRDDNTDRPRSATRAALSASLGGGLVALASLALAFLRQDWRLAYVVGHARPGVGWPTRLTGIWAGPEGSLLLWATMLAAATLLTAKLTRSVWSRRLLALTTAAYALTVATVSTPFERLPAPPGAGTGLQPVLEHPAMLWHPPVLYLGMVAMLVPTALVAGAAIDGRPPPPSTTRATLVALAALTAGLATGANWAYVELGWGGYWAWDPIENAGLVAWLAGGALLHRLEGSNPLRPRAVLLAVLPGLATIWATTITRTGLLSSVHAFADRPGLRRALLTIAVVFTVAVFATVLLAWLRARRSASKAEPSPMASDRRRSLPATLIVLAAGLITAIGTYEPALEMLFRDDTFTIAGRFFSTALWPVAVIGCLYRIRSVSRKPALATGVTAAAAASGAVVAMIIVGGGVGLFALVLAAAAGAAAAVTILERWSTPTRSWLAHLGMAVLLVGVVGSTVASTTTVVVLTAESVPTPIGELVHRGVELSQGEGTNEAIGLVDIQTSGQWQRFEPRLISYTRSGAASAEVATDRGWLSDRQVTLIDATTEQATYRVSYQPRMSLLWLGSALTSLGLALSAVRLTTAAPTLVGKNLVERRT